MAGKSSTFEPSAAYAHYDKGLVLSRKGCKERALTSFKEALVAELEQTVPDGLNLRLFRDKIREIESDLFSQLSLQRSPAPLPQ